MNENEYLFDEILRDHKLMAKSFLRRYSFIGIEMK